MKSMITIVSVAVSALFFLPAAQAAEQGDSGGCRAEVQKYCADVKPGGGRMLHCLKAHEGDLSPTCRERMAEGRRKMESFSEACKADAEKLCNGIEPGKGRIVHCMREHKAELSPDCREKIDKMGKRRK